MCKSCKSYKFSYKIPMKKGTCGNNSYIFEPILILLTQSRGAVCPLVKCKSLGGSDNASRVSMKHEQFLKILSILWNSADEERFAR